MGNKWATPTKEQWEELANWATWTYTSHNDINGWKVSGPNGNSIFLPAIGYMSYNSKCEYGYMDYTSSCKYNTNIWCLCNWNYYSNEMSYQPYVRYTYSYQVTGVSSSSKSPNHYYYGYPIRPVFVENE
jgi:hypothetical protein